MSSPAEYLAKRQQEWESLRLSDKALERLSAAAREEVRRFERQCIDREFALLSEIVTKCTDKLQFAKKYRLLRAEARRVKKAKSSDGDPVSPRSQDDLISEIRARVTEKKLYDTASWFWIKWDDGRTPVLEFRKSIERFADPPGCRLRILGLAALSLLGVRLGWLLFLN